MQALQEVISGFVQVGKVSVLALLFQGGILRERTKCGGAH